MAGLLNLRLLPLALACASGFSLYSPATRATPVLPGAAPSRQSGLEEAAHLRDQRQWLAALAIYERLLAAHPDDEDAYRMRALTLADLGNAERAWQLYRARPSVFSAAQAERLQNDRLARRIVWGGLYAQDTASRLDEMKQAERLMVEHLASLTAEQRAAAHRPRLDSLVILNTLEKHDEVVAAYRSLLADGLQVPPYALAKVGDSLLATRHPEEAAAALETSLAAMPGEFDIQLLLAYAYLESEQHERALTTLDALVKANEPWPRAPGARRGHQNWHRFDADTNRAMVTAYGNRLQEAQTALEALASIAPNNAGLQSRLGNIFSMRGWTGRALERQRMAMTLDPRSTEARIGATESLLALDRVGDARVLHDGLLEQFPGNTHVQRLDRYWDAHLGWRGRAWAAAGRSDAEGASTTASPLGNRDGEYGVYIESPMLADRWRLTAQASDAWADFQGERVHARHTGMGLLYTHDRLSLEAQASRPDDRYLDDTAVGIRAGWRASDTLSASAAAFHADPEASLQARRSGIGADSWQAGLVWTPSEQGQLGARYKHWDYDDGNRRQELGVYGQRRWITRPHLLVDMIGDAYASRGSRDDAPYYNPSQDRAFNGGVRIDHVAWRRYERHLRQRLEITAGSYWQQGHGSAWVPRASYRQELKLGMGHVLDYGISWSRPVYDGQREQHVALDIEYRWGE
ncbi:poly-beta-1,6 N-acetyl-D-glucosamine export porin PgaA [Pseudoxanthomonas sp. Root630]|uniref:poly-beta-1,6 N-acetyl-D-glucosamine export porin PgaA n=1 Tax=Pseudoxanthomonas sp. Root630 TaxID=1736574 RepID=UPI0009D68EAD|nr:poly-beta-1,6 N-acetyl-D-glucosamine export porin PgaA [Pseudoxanthomonas sp. Root630]